MTRARSLLLVEDSADDVLLLKRALHKAQIPHALHVAESGDAALAWLSEAADASRAGHPVPSFVLLDLKLPGRSGFEVLAWIRAHATLRLLPVIVFTTSREGVDVRRAYELGANSYLVKPVRFEDLIETARAMDLYWMRLNESPTSA
jgi:CheY-like chemotaxis protein